MRWDPTDALLLVAVVREGGLAAAGRALGLPPSTVSRRLARLEAEVGARLLHRTTRRSSLTDAGRAFHEHAARALEALEAADRAVAERGAEPAGTVRLTATAGLARFLWDELSAFLDRYPRVQLEIEATDRHVDLVGEGFDLALRSGRASDAGLVGRRLAPARRWLVAAPAYLARRGAPASVEALAHHDVLLGGSRARGHWDLVGPDGPRRVAVSGRVAVSEMGLLLAACRAGRGIALAPANMVAADLAEGRLARVLPEVEGVPSDLWLVFPARRQRPPAVQRLADHLVEVFRRSLPRDA